MVAGNAAGYHLRGVVGDAMRGLLRMLAGSPPDCETRNVNTEEEFRLMVSHQTGRLPSKAIHFIVTNEARRGMKNWDFEVRQMARWVLCHPCQNRNVKANYTAKDIGVNE